MKLEFDAMYYEPASLDYILGKELREKYNKLKETAYRQELAREIRNAPDMGRPLRQKHL